MNEKNRLDFLDHLRSLMIFLVVVYHAGLVYDSTGAAGFFWMVYDMNAAHPLTDEINLVLDIFIMAVLFFISGYLTPHSLEKKGPGRFLWTKLKRLMLPWTVAALTLIPLYKVIFLYSRGLPQEHWTAYFHFSNGIISQNWLWFLPILFGFDLIYLLLSRLRLSTRFLSMKSGVALVFVAGLFYSLCMVHYGLEGWTKNVLVNFQNERLFIYFLMFLLGALACRRRIFDGHPARPWRLAMVGALVVIPFLTYRFFTFHVRFGPDEWVFSGHADTLLRWIAFHLTLAGLVYLSIQGFRLIGNRWGRLCPMLSVNSYGVYLIHNVVIGGFALILVNWDGPFSLKYPILIVSSYALSLVLVMGFNQLKARSSI